jgi:hypothetical protein
MVRPRNAKSFQCRMGYRKEISGRRSNAHFGAMQQKRGTSRMRGTLLWRARTESATEDVMSQKSRQQSSRPGTDEYNAIPIPPRTEDRPTEDDLARAALGGPKGSPELPPAPLTKTEEEQNSPNDDPGHVA